MIETVYDLFRKLTNFTADTQVLIAPSGAIHLHDMKFVDKVETLTAEGQTWCVIRTSSE
jgi:hypothetical protein